MRDLHQAGMKDRDIMMLNVFRQHSPSNTPGFNFTKNDHQDITFDQP